MYRSRWVLPLVALAAGATIVAVGATTTTPLEEDIVEVHPSFTG